MARPPKTDGWFRDPFAAAQREGKVLRYVGSIEGGRRCKVAIKAVAGDEPVQGKDGENALAFFSTYYQPISPGTARGYGAGTEVTAAGVRRSCCAPRTGSRSCNMSSERMNLNVEIGGSAGGLACPGLQRQPERGF